MACTKSIAKGRAGRGKSGRPAAVFPCSSSSSCPSQHSTPTPTPTPFSSGPPVTAQGGGAQGTKCNGMQPVVSRSPPPAPPVEPTASSALELPVDGRPGHLDTVRRTTGSFYLCNLPPANHRVALCCHTAHSFANLQGVGVGCSAAPHLRLQRCLTTVMGMSST